MVRIVAAVPNDNVRLLVPHRNIFGLIIFDTSSIVLCSSICVKITYILNIEIIPICSGGGKEVQASICNFTVLERSQTNGRQIYNEIVPFSITIPINVEYITIAIPAITGTGKHLTIKSAVRTIANQHEFRNLEPTVKVDNSNIRIIPRGGHTKECMIAFRNQFSRSKAVIMSRTQFYIRIFCNLICTDKFCRSHRIRSFGLLRRSLLRRSLLRRSLLRRSLLRRGLLRRSFLRRSFLRRGLRRLRHICVTGAGSFRPNCGFFSRSVFRLFISMTRYCGNHNRSKNKRYDHNLFHDQYILSILFVLELKN